MYLETEMPVSNAKDPNLKLKALLLDPIIIIEEVGPLTGTVRSVM